MSNSPAEYLTSLFGLTGKNAAVIGGTGVLGGAIADCLAAAGAHIFVVGRSADAGERRVKEIQSAGGSAEFVAADVTSRQDLQALRDHAEQKGGVDILVNGAGVNAATPFLEISDEEWDRIFGINLGSI
ncbi:MAG: SDR family NAD(P)-dependent oxidoreductase, partial [Planctomycetaceae bacterium]|nr:SDR family NAD(P)-dependent oxidoreductase [Planctomycetaceae bacterium]